MIENQEPLVRAIINAFLFLENSGDDEVDPHSAVKAMEDIAYPLLTLSDKDQLKLRAALSAIADTETDEGYKRFVSELADHVDLKR